MYVPEEVEADYYQPSVRAVQRRVSRNKAKVTSLVPDVFDQWSRYLVLVLTLTYRDDLRPFTDFRQLEADRDAFFYYTYTDEHMSRVQDYIWKIEFGEDNGGLHLHLVAFFDGSARKDIFYARAIGEYWVRITGGRGGFYSSNGSKKKNAKGPYGDITGVINRGDSDKRQRLTKYLVTYTAKDEQQVPFRTEAHSRLFGTSR